MSFISNKFSIKLTSNVLDLTFFTRHDIVSNALYLLWSSPTPYILNTYHVGCIGIWDYGCGSLDPLLPITNQRNWKTGISVAFHQFCSPSLLTAEAIVPNRQLRSELAQWCCLSGMSLQPAVPWLPAAAALCSPCDSAYASCESGRKTRVIGEKGITMLNVLRSWSAYYTEPSQICLKRNLYNSYQCKSYNCYHSLIE